VCVAVCVAVFCSVLQCLYVLLIRLLHVCCMCVAVSGSVCYNMCCMCAVCVADKTLAGVLQCMLQFVLQCVAVCCVCC